MSGCVSQRHLKTEFSSQTSEVTRDTLREQVMVVVFDTIREVTTITICENEQGDTLRATTITDRTRASSRDHYHDVKEKVLVKTDTVYIQKEADKQFVAAGPNVEIDKDGNVTKHVNRTAQTLKWVFFILAAIIVSIITIKIFK